jgi:hypothetical protein
MYNNGEDEHAEMTVEINLANDKKINFVLYNYHNCYYTLPIWVNLFENDYAKPRTILKTCL